VHLGTCKVMYHEWAFGPARLTWPEVDVPGTPADALALLDRGQALLSEALGALDEARLDEPVSTNWGERWPAWRIFTVMTDHDALHGGAVGCLRDLYRWMRE
jgi:DinB superfamily